VPPGRRPTLCRAVARSHESSRVDWHVHFHQSTRLCCVDPSHAGRLPLARLGILKAKLGPFHQPHGCWDQGVGTRHVGCAGSSQLSFPGCAASLRCASRSSRLHHRCPSAPLPSGGVGIQIRWSARRLRPVRLAESASWTCLLLLFTAPRRFPLLSSHRGLGVLASVRFGWVACRLFGCCPIQLSMIAFTGLNPVVLPARARFRLNLLAFAPVFHAPRCFRSRRLCSMHFVPSRLDLRPFTASRAPIACALSPRIRSGRAPIPFPCSHPGRVKPRRPSCA